MGGRRTRSYEWKSLAEHYGTDALVPKPNRWPQLPTATLTHDTNDLLTLGVNEPTLRARRLADRLF